MISPSGFDRVVRQLSPQVLGDIGILADTQEGRIWTIPHARDEIEGCASDGWRLDEFLLQVGADNSDTLIVSYSVWPCWGG